MVLSFRMFLTRSNAVLSIFSIVLLLLQIQASTCKTAEKDLVDDPTLIEVQPLIKAQDLSVDVAVFVDAELYQKYTTAHNDKADTELQEFVATVIKNIQAIYRQSNMAPSMNFRYVHYEVFKTQPKEIDSSAHNNGDGGQYIDAFCGYVATMADYKKWQFSLLFTGYDLHDEGDTSLRGISKIKGMCDPANYCTISEGIDFSAVYIAAHEMGHSLSMGMKHDEEECAEDTDGVMSESLGAGKVHWTSCSFRYYQDFLAELEESDNTRCLTASAGGLMPVLTENDAIIPGEKYNADKQCALAGGSEDYIQMSKNKDESIGVCHMIWCGKKGARKIKTLHPALEGTMCNTTEGTAKYCRLGKCVEWEKFNESWPNAVDGKWSDWQDITCKPCTCPSILDAVAVLPNTRSCNSPTPINGGAFCDGSSIRGIICDMCTTNVNATKLEDYTGKICLKIYKEGKSVSYRKNVEKSTADPCKIFCKTKDPKMVYGPAGTLPNGTPCGTNKYCLHGECMELSCSKTVLLRSTSTSAECPKKGCL